MSGFNWERAAYGFGYGALSGYDSILKQQRQEEYERRKADAEMERQKNLAMWQEKNINAPRRQEERTNQLADIQSQRTYENDPTIFKNKMALDQFDLQKQTHADQVNYQNSQLGISRQNLQLSRDQNENLKQLRELQVQEAQLKIDEAKARRDDPMKDERKANEVFSNLKYEEVLKKGGSEAEAEAAKTIAILSGAKTQNEFNEMSRKSDGAMKQSWELGSKVAEQTSKRLDEALASGKEGQSLILQEATSISGSKVSGVGEAKAIIINDSVKNAVIGFQSSFTSKPDQSTTNGEKIPTTLNKSQLDFLSSALSGNDAKKKADAEAYIKRIESIDPARAAQIKDQIEKQKSKLTFSEEELTPDKRFYGAP